LNLFYNLHELIWNNAPHFQEKLFSLQRHFFFNQRPFSDRIKFNNDTRVKNVKLTNQKLINLFSKYPIS